MSVLWRHYFDSFILWSIVMRIEKVKLQAEARAAEEARKKAEEKAAADAKKKRDLERELARQALQQVRLVECDIDTRMGFGDT